MLEAGSGMPVMPYSDPKSALDIELMWAETRADRTAQSCSLVYDISAKEPQEMRIAVQKSVTMLFITFNYISLIPWKTPDTA
jgi:hypothetical protein